MIINSYIFGTGTGNLYTTANAANPDNEVDATTGFSQMTTVSFATSSSSPQHGTWHVEMTSTGSSPAVCRGLIALDVENGETYEIKLYAKEITGSSFELHLVSSDGWTSSDGGQSTTTSWVEYTLTGTTTSTTPSIRLFGTSSTNNGDKLGIDNIRVTKTS